MLSPMVSRKIVRVIALLGLALTLWCAQTPATHAQDEVTWLLTQINNLRASLGLPPYSLNAQLSTAATLHSQYMVNTCDISHTEANGSTPTSRARAQGYTGSWISENIYMGQLARAEDAWNFWINSPIHYQGLTHNVINEVGIGVAYGECGQGYTLLFGHRDDVSAPAAPPAPPAANNDGSGSSAPPPTQAPYVPPPPTRTPTPTVPTITPSYTWTPTAIVSPSPTHTTTPTATATNSPTPLVLPTVAASDTLPPTAPTVIAQLPSASSTASPSSGNTPPPTPTVPPTPSPAAQSAPSWLPPVLFLGAALLTAVGGWLLWRAR